MRLCRANNDIVMTESTSLASVRAHSGGRVSFVPFRDWPPMATKWPPIDSKGAGFWAGRPNTGWHASSWRGKKSTTLGHEKRGSCRPSDLHTSRFKDCTSGKISEFLCLVYKFVCSHFKDE